ncbi:MAG TPA: hypothetical protein VNI36_04400 [Candidatus Dormibacteraeota bacterium]|nr:hypothetical protein [Candidatus Dormibacteraeota bacterium]
MSLRKTLLALLVVVAVSPAWAATEPLGSVTSTNAATIRDMNLTAGSTIFSGDVISVATKGAAQVTLASGAQVEILGNSAVRLTKTAGSVQITVNRGQASFHSSSGIAVSAQVADATVRPLNSSETSAVIQSLSGTHAIVAAQKGALLVTTAHDGKTYTLLQGQAADLAASAVDPQRNGGAVPAGKAAPSVKYRSKKAAYWTIAVVGAGASITAYLLSRNNPKQSTTTLQNEVSPHTLN